MQKQDIITQLKIKYGMIPAEPPGFDLLDPKMRSEITDLHTLFSGTIDKNEAQLIKQIEQAKENLRKERQQFIDEVLGFSNDCNDLKENYQSVIKLTEDLESEESFLNEQLICYLQFAHENNSKLLRESQNLRKQILEFDKDFNFMDDMEFWESLPKIHSSQQKALNKNKSQNTLKKDQNSNQSKSIQDKSQQSKDLQYQQSNLQKEQICLTPEEIFKTQQMIGNLNQQNKKIKNILGEQVFEQNRLQLIFQESVLAVLNKQYAKKTNQSLPSEERTQEKNLEEEKETLEQEVQKQETGSSQMSQSLSKEASTTIDPSNLFFEQDLTELQQKQIMELFLTNEEIKRYIYDQIMLQNKDEGTSKPK